ncbi:hypothetical protein K438DRAFT_1967610 [Mycena galopus ATCC 62051]|nr:hypothetical protein K438DRAFT_1967610 [Mycena galopus ATCC 62051]
MPHIAPSIAQLRLSMLHPRLSPTATASHRLTLAAAVLHTIFASPQCAAMRLASRLNDATAMYAFASARVHTRHEPKKFCIELAWGVVGRDEQKAYLDPNPRWNTPALLAVPRPPLGRSRRASIHLDAVRVPLWQVHAPASPPSEYMRTLAEAEPFTPAPQHRVSTGRRCTQSPSSGVGHHASAVGVEVILATARTAIEVEVAQAAHRTLPPSTRTDVVHCVPVADEPAQEARVLCERLVHAGPSLEPVIMRACMTPSALNDAAKRGCDPASTPLQWRTLSVQACMTAPPCTTTPLLVLRAVVLLVAARVTIHACVSAYAAPPRHLASDIEIAQVHAAAIQTRRPGRRSAIRPTARALRSACHLAPRGRPCLYQANAHPHRSLPLLFWALSASSLRSLRLIAADLYAAAVTHVLRPCLRNSSAGMTTTRYVDATTSILEPAHLNSLEELCASTSHVRLHFKCEACVPTSFHNLEDAHSVLLRYCALLERHRGSIEEICRRCRIQGHPHAAAERALAHATRIDALVEADPTICIHTDGHSLPVVVAARAAAADLLEALGDPGLVYDVRPEGCIDLGHTRILLVTQAAAARVHAHTTTPTALRVPVSPLPSPEGVQRPRIDPSASASPPWSKLVPRATRTVVLNLSDVELLALTRLYKPTAVRSPSSRLRRTSPPSGVDDQDAVARPTPLLMCCVLLTALILKAALYFVEQTGIAAVHSDRLARRCSCVRSAWTSA